MDEANATRSELGFFDSVKDGLKVSESRKSVTSVVGYPKDAFGGIIGRAEVSSGMITYGFHIKSNASMARSTEIAVGVVDADSPVNAVHVGKGYGFHVGKARVVKSLHGHKLRSITKALSYDTPRSLPFDQDGRIDIMCFVNMETRRLAIAINERTPIDCGFTLPPSVRPWVWLGLGAGSVELAEYRFAETPSHGVGWKPSRAHEKTHFHTPRPSAENTGPTAAAAHPPAPAPVDITDSAAKPPLAPLAVPLASARAKDLPSSAKDDDGSGTDRTSAESSLGDEPEQWTARAAAWLLPLQQMFHNEKEKGEIKDEELLA